MRHLVIGPSSVGKSTFIKDHLIPASDAAIVVRLASEMDLTPDPMDQTIIHYNLLRCFQNHRSYLGAGLNDDPLFAKVLEGLDNKDGVWILVASRGKLAQRVLTRTELEPDLRAEDQSTYPAARVFELIAHLDLRDLYTALFAELDHRLIEYHVVSTENRDFTELERGDALELLEKNEPQHYGQSEVKHVAELFPSDYHSVRLPFDVSTKGADRTATADIVLGDKVEGSVLDVGCAYGFYVFEAERRGASSVVGIEAKPDRFAAACAYAQVLGSAAEFRHGEAPQEMGADERFDLVLLLNVLHHVHEPIRFLRKLARHCTGSLIIEFPTLDDSKFLRTVESVPEGLNGLPLIGVSLAEQQDQTFLFTDTSLTRILIENNGLFASASFVASPVAPDRRIGIFRRNPQALSAD